MAEGRKISRSKEKLQSKASNLQLMQSEIESNESTNISGENTIENLVWKDLTEEQVVSFVTLTPQELESKLAQILSFHKYHICLKEASLVDYYVSAFWFAAQAKFTSEQISAFFSLVKVLLENLRDEKMTIAKNVCQMKKYLGNGSNSRKSARLFSTYQTKLITDYITESLFQHYKLYELLFSSELTDEPAIKHRLLVEVPPAAECPFPPPLDEALPEEVHSEHVLGLRQSSMNTSDITNDIKDNGINIQEVKQEQNKDITSEVGDKTPESLLISLKPDEMKQVLKDVSHEILGEVKNNVQKKLKERESSILTKMSKK